MALGNYALHKVLSSPTQANIIWLFHTEERKPKIHSCARDEKHFKTASYKFCTLCKNWWRSFVVILTQNMQRQAKLRNMQGPDKSHFTIRYFKIMLVLNWQPSFNVTRLFFNSELVSTHHVTMYISCFRSFNFSLMKLDRFAPEDCWSISSNSNIEVISAHFSGGLALALNDFLIFGEKQFRSMFARWM